MKLVRTVKKEINPSDLGWCQCHEHIFLADGPSKQINKALYMDDCDKSLAETIIYKQAGGQSFVDAQPYGCGRMAENLLSVSEQTGVNIIACTGFHKTEFFQDSNWLEQQEEETLARIYAEEVKRGMYGFNKTRLSAKAGLVKCAAIKGEHRANRTYKKLFSAAAVAAAITGAPIIVHMDKGADAFSILRFFESYKIQPNRIILCHLDRTKYDFGYHEEIAAAGAYLEYDTIRRLKYHSDEKEADLIEHMVSKGYGDKLLLSMDTTNQRLKSYGADFGLDYILTTFRYLLETRLDKDEIQKIMIENPANALSF